MSLATTSKGDGGFALPRGGCRRIGREPCSLRAKCSYEGNLLTTALVSNMSAAGFRMLITRNTWLPYQFDVHVLGTPKPIRVRQVWRREDEVGVEIIHRSGQPLA